MSTGAGGREGVALLIGINAYQRSDRVWPLPCATADARALRDHLVDREIGGFSEDQVVLLTDAEANRDEVVRRLSSWLPANSRKKEIAVIYFAGHGVVQRIGSRDEGFLLPYDADPDNVMVRGIAMSDVLGWIENVHDAAVVICLDCCHAAKAIPRHAGAADLTPRHLGLGPEVIRRISGSGRFILAACAEGQYSYELSELGHGLFTHYLLKGIEGEGDRDLDGKVGIAELFDYVSDSVERHSRSALGVEQKPWISITTTGRVHISRSRPSPPTLTLLGPSCTLDVVPLANTESTGSRPEVSAEIRDFDRILRGGDEDDLLRNLNRLAKTDDPARIPCIFQCLRVPSPLVQKKAWDVVNGIGLKVLVASIKELAGRADEEEMGHVLGGIEAIKSNPELAAALEDLVDTLKGSLRNRAILLLERKRLSLDLEETISIFRSEQSQYQIKRVLGQGLITAAYLAYDKVNRLDVVVRILRKEFAHQPKVRTQFLDLGWKCIPLVHQNLISTRDVRSFSARGIYFAVRKYIDGVTLQKARETGTTFAPKDALALLRQVVDALRPLHEEGMPHGGIKPSNIFFTRGNRTILGDPSLPATAVGVALERLSYDYRYAPPELFQAAGLLTPQSDFYSLGCVAFELFCGSPPFVSESHRDLATEHILGRIDPPSRRGSALGRAGDEFVLKLLTRSAPARPVDVDEVLRAIDQLEHAAVSPPKSESAPPSGPEWPNVRFDNLDSMVGFDASGMCEIMTGLEPGPPGPSDTLVQKRPSLSEPIGTPVAGSDEPGGSDPGGGLRISDTTTSATGHPVSPGGDLSPQPGLTHSPVAADCVPELDTHDPEVTPHTNVTRALGAEGSWPTPSGTPEIQPGQIVFDKYRVQRLLGSGGMGNVWLVTHLELGSERALKVIRRAMGLDPAIRARFAREARVMARFSHPNAVTIHDARLAGDEALIEMEYVAGKNLSEILTTGVAQPLDWTARILEQLCDVLDAAHQIGIVHRDLKPRNLMLVDGRPPGKEHLKVLDFGLVKILGTELPDELTSPGVFLGTALYASPEQIEEAHLDARSDIYSVGVILYELLTGHRPFRGSTSKIVYQQVHVRPPPFYEVNPDVRVPAKVEELVHRCLAKDPADRPQSARALAVEFRERAQTTLWPPSSPDGTVVPEQKLMQWSSLPLLLAFNVIVLLAFALITYWFLRR
jgi:serine/threonine protein kinase/uncharacterized caspase-like protein